MNKKFSCNLQKRELSSRLLITVCNYKITCGLRKENHKKSINSFN